MAAVVGFILLGLSGCSKSNAHMLEGEWTARDAQGKEVRLVFGPGTRFRALSNGVRTDGTYWEDFRESPPQLDLKLENGDIVQTIVQLKGDSIQIQTVKPGEARPKAFTREVILYTKANPIFLTPTPTRGAKRR